MKSYTLYSAAYPHISDGNKAEPTQAEILYKCLEPFGSVHTLEELIAAAKKRNYEITFKKKDAVTVRESLLYHLNLFEKAKFVRVVEDAD